MCVQVDTSGINWNRFVFRWVWLPQSSGCYLLSTYIVNQSQLMSLEDPWSMKPICVIRFPVYQMLVVQTTPAMHPHEHFPWPRTFHIPLLRPLRRAQDMKKGNSMNRVINHDGNKACKTGAGNEFGQREEEETNSDSDNSPECAIGRKSLSWASLVAISVEYRFTMPKHRSDQLFLPKPSTETRKKITYLNVNPTNSPFPIFSSLSAMFSKAVCLSCTSLYLAISASLLKSSK